MHEPYLVVLPLYMLNHEYCAMCRKKQIRITLNVSTKAHQRDTLIIWFFNSAALCIRKLRCLFYSISHSRITVEKIAFR